MTLANRFNVPLVGLLCFTLLCTAEAEAVEDPTLMEACGLENTAPGVGGRFEASIGDGVSPDTVHLEGFATSSGRVDAGWSAQLLTPGGENSVLFITLYSGRPAPGTYPVVDYVATDATPPTGQYVALVSLPGDILGATGFFSVKGNLTIASSEPTAVAGCFDFAATGLHQGGSVKASGTFVAKNTDH